MFHQQKNQVIIEKEYKSIENQKGDYKVLLDEQKLEFTSEAVNIQLPGLDQQFNETQQIMRLSFDTILMCFKDQSVLLAFNIRKKYIESFFDTQLALKEDIAQLTDSSKKKKPNVLKRIFTTTPKPKAMIYEIEIMQKVVSRFSIVVVVKLIDINTLLLINFTNPKQPYLVQKIMIEFSSIRSMIQLQPKRPLLLIQDSESILHLFKFNQGLLEKVNEYNKFQEKESKHPKIQGQQVCRQTLAQLSYVLIDDDSRLYNKSKSVLVAFIHNQCHLVILNLDSFSFQILKTIDTFRPTCVVDLNSDLFLITSQNKTQMIIQKSNFDLHAEFMGSSVMITEVLKIRQVGDDSHAPVLLFNQQRRQVIWSLNKDEKYFKILSQIKLNYPLSCMLYIGDIDEYQMLLIGGFNRGNVLAFIYANK